MWAGADTPAIPVVQTATEEAFRGLTYTPGPALAAFLLGLVELVILALAVFYMLRRQDEQRLSQVLLKRDMAERGAAPAAGVDRAAEGGGPLARTRPVTPELPEATAATARVAEEELSTNHRQGQVSLPSVVISNHLIPEIHAYMSAFLQEHGEENEAGVVLVGEFLQNDSQPTFKIHGFIPAGPKADFSAGSIYFDTQWQTSVLAALRVQNPGLMDVGMAHRHPGQFDTCSAGDEADDRRAVQASPTKALVFGIVTIGNSKQDPRSLYFKNFKIDVFVMTQDTGLKYVKVKPLLEDIPLVKPSPALVALCENGRAHTAFYDFAVLRHLGARVVVRSVEQNRAPAVLCTITPKEAGCVVNVLCEKEGSLQVSVSGADGQIQQFSGPWEQPATGRQVWLSHLVLTILAHRHWADQPSPDGRWQEQQRNTNGTQLC